jgi:hypothetical protein
MRDGQWRTLEKIHAFAGGSEAAVSARPRDLRKPRFCGYRVERRRCVCSNLWEYRLLNTAVESEAAE